MDTLFCYQFINKVKKSIFASKISKNRTLHNVCTRSLICLSADRLDEHLTPMKIGRADAYKNITIYAPVA